MNMQMVSNRATAKRALRRFGRGLAVLALTAASLSAMANEAATAQKVVDQAHCTFKSFAADPDMRWFKEHVGQAQGIMIIPELGKGGFILAPPAVVACSCSVTRKAVCGATPPSRVWAVSPLASKRASRWPRSSC